MDDLEASRRRMVDRDLRARGIKDERVLRAMGSVPREEFVARDLRALAYDDGPLPIGDGQTISQPWVVACMAEALGLTGSERVLEVGSGCGYAAAVLSRLCREVFAIERIGRLGDDAAKRLVRLGLSNVHVRVADGSLGWPEHAPFDGIVVSAAAADVPRRLREQLAKGGRLVVPVGASDALQRLVKITRRGDASFDEVSLGPVRFVPLVTDLADFS